MRNFCAFINSDAHKRISVQNAIGKAIAFLSHNHRPCLVAPHCHFRDVLWVHMGSGGTHFLGSILEKMVVRAMKSIMLGMGKVLGIP